MEEGKAQLNWLISKRSTLLDITRPDSLLQYFLNCTNDEIQKLLRGRRGQEGGMQDLRVCPTLSFSLTQARVRP